MTLMALVALMALMTLMDTWILALVCLGLPWSALVCLGLSWSVLVCFGLPWSTLICLGLLGLFQITIERLKCSKAISGRVGIGWDGMEISKGTDSKSTALRC